MNKLRKRFWLYVILVCILGTLAWFLAYSFLNARKIFGWEFSNMVQKGLLPWYHPAVFWGTWFTNWYTRTFSEWDPAKVSSAVLTTIEVGLGLSIIMCEAAFLLTGREWFAKRVCVEASENANDSMTHSRPWYLIAYVGISGIMFSFAVLAVLGMIVITMWFEPSVAFMSGSVVVVLASMPLFFLFGIWRWKRWGFWGLVWFYTILLLIGVFFVSNTASNASTLVWFSLLLLVTFWGGKSSVWNKLR